MKTLTNQATHKGISLLSYIGAALAFALIITQFIPFWGCYQCSTCGDGRIISINEYVWLASEHKTGLTSTLQKYYIPDFAAIDVVGISTFIQLASIAGIVMCLSKPQKNISALLLLLAGLLCVVGYLVQPAYQMGQLWQAHLGIGIALSLCALAILAIRFAGAYKKAKKELQSEAI